MEQAEISAEEIDLILVATATPDMLFPATACFVQKKIGAKKAACLDISAACAGFLFGGRDRAAIHHFAYLRHRARHRRGEADLDHQLDRSQHLCAFRRRRRRGHPAASRQRPRRHQHPHRKRWRVYRHPFHARRRFALSDHGGECAHDISHTIHMSGKEVYKQAVIAMLERRAEKRWIKPA